MVKLFTFALCLAAISFESALSQEVCAPGDRREEPACKASVSANWNETKSADCDYDAPDGWAIESHEVIENSSHNGSKSVALLAGGSRFASSSDFEATRLSSNNYLAQYTDKKGDNKYKASFDANFNNSLRLSRQYSATHQHIHGEVEASGSGDFFNRERGWMDITVIARLVCIGPPSPARLQKALFKKIGISEQELKSIKIKNSEDKSLTVFLHWKKASGDWTTGGGWKFSPGESGTLRQNGTPVMTANKIIYYYAFSDDLSCRLQGGNQSISVRVDGKDVPFRLYAVTSGESNYTIDLYCNEFPPPK